MTPILAAFWHRTRREFVAMTADDLARKIDKDSHQVVREVRSLVLDGAIVASNYREKGKTIYELPKFMQDQVLAGVIQ